MKVKVKFIDDNAEALYLRASDGKSPFPFKTYNDDFCYDVVATSCEEVAPNVYKYGIGLAFQIERGVQQLSSGGDIHNIDGVVIGFEPGKYLNLSASPIKLSLDLRPRSSIWETGMSLSNCEGTVDEIFTGEVSAVFYHLMPNMPKYEVGDKIAQLKIGITFPCEFVEVEKLNETARNNGGYGSTGK